MRFDDKKIIILIGDGMSDYPIDALNGRTPLEAAATPNMDHIAKNGILGLTKTIPEGMNPGSDVANLSIFGYDPSTCYTGRAPLEALNMNIDLGPDDVAFRCNIVSIEDDIMTDFSADHIDTQFTNIVIEELRRNIDFGTLELYGEGAVGWSFLSCSCPVHPLPPGRSGSRSRPSRGRVGWVRRSMPRSVSGRRRRPFGKPRRL